MWIEIEMYVLLFFACSFLGWCMEVTCKLVQFGRFINRGFLLGPLCPIYGTGAVLMAYFLPLWTTQVESTFLLALVLCGTLEYIGSTSIVGVEKKQIISSSVGRIPGTAFMRGKTGCVF